jgi:hypothetical protein
MYLKDFRLPIEAPDGALKNAPGVAAWEAADHSALRLYASAPVEPQLNWQLLESIVHIPGHSFGEAAVCHYVVETDCPESIEQELNDWYNIEHLPGLAQVPGTISAWRYVRKGGSPKYLACYDLTTAGALESAQWLAVRNSAWSSKIRPYFQNTLRTLYFRPGAAP